MSGHLTKDKTFEGCLAGYRGHNDSSKSNLSHNW